MGWNSTFVSLLDDQYFEVLNGLWTGKKPPLTLAGVIRNTNFTTSGAIDFTNIAWLQVESKQFNKRQLRKGDIVIERSGGGPSQPVGRVVFFDRDEENFSFSNFTTTIRVMDRSTIDPRFVFYRLLELYQSGNTEDIQRRTTGIRNLDFHAYKERATFPLIPLDEQRKIAAVLSLVQHAIEQQERLIALTTELKKALMHKLFTEGLHGEPQKETEIGLVPESWVCKALAEVNLDITYGTSTKCSVEGPGYPVLRIPNVINGALDLTDIKYGNPTRGQLETLRLVEGDVLFVRTNGVQENAGRCAVYRQEMEPCYFASYLLRVRTNPNALLPEFLAYFCETDMGRKQLAGRAIRTADGKFNINSDTLRTLSIPLPSLVEQEDISTIFRLHDRKLVFLNMRLKSLGDLFRTLLHQLMTAQIRVNDLDLSELEAGVEAVAV